MKVTYYGHSCFSVQTKDVNILFDPFIRPNALASHINVEEIKPDVILLSHGHWDHMADLVEIANNSGAKVVSNFEIITWFQNQGLTNLHPMNIGGAWKFEWGKVKYVNAIHSSAMPDGSYGGNPGGFVVTTDEGNFYYSGDTALTLDFQLIGEQFDLNFCLLPIGDNLTMGVEDAIICADFVQCDTVIGVHYDTFPPITINHEKAKAEFAEMEKELILMKIGSSWEI